MAGLVFATSIAIAGCDSVEGMRDMKDAQGQLKGIVKEELGVDSLVGFNIDKDVLIDVSFAFNARSLGCDV